MPQQHIESKIRNDAQLRNGRAEITYAGRAGVTYAEENGVGHINSLEKALSAWVVVLELLHGEDEVRDDEEQHGQVER